MRLGRQALIDTLAEDVERLSLDLGVRPGDALHLDLGALRAGGALRWAVVEALQRRAEALRGERLERLAACEAALATIREVDQVPGAAPRAGGPPSVLTARLPSFPPAPLPRQSAIPGLKHRAEALKCHLCSAFAAPRARQEPVAPTADFVRRCREAADAEELRLKPPLEVLIQRLIGIWAVRASPVGGEGAAQARGPKFCERQGALTPPARARTAGA